MRLIDADAIDKKLDEIKNEPDYQHEDEDWCVGVIIAQNELFDAPTIEAEPVKHGRWENCFEQDGEKAGCCSECHAIRFVDPYCPNCGAKMDGAEP